MSELLGAPAHPGTLLFGISGHVNKPGVYELETGIPLMTIINDVCGGVKNGKEIKMVIPGGLHGDVATAAIVVNSIPGLLKAAPSLVVMSNMPPPHPW